MNINKYFEYLILGYKNYFKYKGRTTVQQFWCYQSFVIFISSIIFVGLTTSYFLNFLIIYWVWILFSFIPGTAIFCRRLHDMNKSGWVQCYFFLAVVIAVLLEKLSLQFAQILHILIFFIWMFYLSQKSSNGKNKYDKPI
jgi:uncharacterized membrane protein YhaH (DUF805 family)